MGLLALLVHQRLLVDAQPSSEVSTEPEWRRGSPVDCNFDSTQGPQGPMCGWRPDTDGAALWHTGTAVLVDSAHSIVKSSPKGWPRFFLKTQAKLHHFGFLLIDMSFGKRFQQKSAHVTYFIV